MNFAIMSSISQIRFDLFKKISESHFFGRILSKIQASYTMSSYLKERSLDKEFPLRLTNFEKKVFSQNGEDGILEEIFHRIGTSNKYFVEFGIQDGSESCTRLLLEMGWSGTWIEGDRNFYEKAQSRFSKFKIQVLNHFITNENILEIFSSAKIPIDLDLLAVDIDGNDYWILSKILEKYKPRVIVLEYNSSFLSSENWVMPYNAAHSWDGTNKFGASLKAYCKLASQKNYSLVACDTNGINCFLIRDDVMLGLRDKFSRPGDINFLYTTAKYNSQWLGHPPSKKSFCYSPMEKISDADFAKISICFDEQPKLKIYPNSYFNLQVSLKNSSQCAIRSTAPHSINLSYRWISASDGQIAAIEGLRTSLPGEIRAGASCTMKMTCHGPSIPGVYHLQLTLVQEGIMWQDQLPEIQKVLSGQIEVRSQ